MKFSELGLAKRISDDLETLGFTEPTEIQVKAIPPILEGKDILGSAETGSGKTAAYALPIVQALRSGSKHMPRALILVPTRELAVQVSDEVVRFANKCGMRVVTIYGGVGFEKQARLLNRGVDVIVATPGRLNDHIEQGNAKLANVSFLVLDEADRMLDMGFTPQVRKIVGEIKGPRQTVMFSATINKAVARSGEEFLKDPITVAVNSDRVEPISIEQKIHLVQEEGKTQLLVSILNGQLDGQLDERTPGSAGSLPAFPDSADKRTVLVFTKTRHRATKICKILNGANIRAGEIHSDISQNKRESTLKQFRDGRISVLVATDIAARGLDVPSISHVVNYDLPLSAADYVHRIGRTGRAGRSGIALSFVSDDQRYLVRDIEKVTGRSLDPDSPFSASRSDSRGPRASRNRQSSGRNGGRGSNSRHGSLQSEGHGRPGSDARRDRVQSEGRGRPASEARHFGEKQRGGFDATRTQRSEQTPANEGFRRSEQTSTNEGFRRSEQSQASEGPRSYAAKPHRSNEGAEAFTSNRAKKYLPQSNFWLPSNERIEPTERTERKQRTDRTDRTDRTERTERTQREERVVIGSGLTAERPKPKFDRFKKKRAEGSSPYSRTEGSSEREGQSGSRRPDGYKPWGNKSAGSKPEGYKPAKSRDGQSKAFEFRGSAKRTSSIISKKARKSN
ncbi:MAG: DEAD/DEAH box helicase [Candidatus Melainabacteria bacterium]|nr:DEAD/DEAH box helicase [Candidatus Melainabacteria bacterium]